jgi:hypothetical protein
MSNNLSPFTHQYRGTPISLICTPKDNGEGYWNSVSVEILFNGIAIGSYIRHYPSYTIETFHPFLYRSEWFALYSSNYTATRVAKLSPDNFEDWCGEDGHSHGFCPTAFYVPRYTTTREMFRGKWLETKHFENEYDEEELEEYYSIKRDYPPTPDDHISSVPEGPTCNGEFFCDYGFLSGCVWGDDISWKLRFIDLSQLNEKVLKIEEKFGYFELPNDMKLRDCVRNDSEDYFELNQLRRFSIKKGFLDFS